MRVFRDHWLKAGVAQEMRRVAIHSGTYDGIATEANLRLIDGCRARHEPTGTLLIFTRDAGAHSGGWWKNPDYERCWHLSLSFEDPETGEAAPKDVKLTQEWLELFFGEYQRLLWAEPPYTPQGKRKDVWHYRLFCDPSWTPLLPRGEVYTKQFTESGWMSFSELRGAHAKALAALEPLPGEQ